MPQQSSAELAKKYGGSSVDIAAQFGGKPVEDTKPSEPTDPTQGRSATSRATGGFLNAAGLNPLPVIEQLAANASSPHPELTPIVAGVKLLSPLARLGNVGDAFRKAGLTGAFNELAASIPVIGPAAEHASQRMKSGDVAGGLGEVGGMIAGAGVLPRAASATAAKGAMTVTRAAEGLMQSALKPGVAKMRDVIKGRTTVPPVVKTLLDEGISVTDSGVGKLSRLLTSTNQELKSMIAQSTADVLPTDVATRASTSRPSLATQATPAADLAAFDSAIDEFVSQWGGKTGLKPMTVQEAQAVKQGTYRNLGTKAFGELKGARIEGEKALARGLKEEIEAAVPEVHDVNQRIGRLQEAQDPLGRRVGMAANRDPGGIAPLAGTSAGFLAMLMMRNPAVKSLLARGLYRAAAKYGRVPEGAIRAALIGIASEGEGR